MGEEGEGKGKGSEGNWGRGGLVIVGGPRSLPRQVAIVFAYEPLNLTLNNQYNNFHVS